jgi:hypothetical protein
MCGKKLVYNLANYIDSLSSISIPVVTFDNHNDTETPSVIVGYSEEEISFPGSHGHYTVSGDVVVIYQGYEDLNNSNADTMAERVIETLCDRNALETALNKPLSGTDTRPMSGFGINQLFVRGTSREDLDHSTQISIRYDAFCSAIDFN